MKRNLIIITGLIVLFFALMLTGNILIIGEKIATVTHLWWTEYLFYGIIAVIVMYYLVLPFVHIYRTPPFPVLSLNDQLSLPQLQQMGASLVSHCNFIPDKPAAGEDSAQPTLRTMHQQQLKQQLTDAADDETRLRYIIQHELDLRFSGNPELGVLGINRRIREWAKSVFMVTAISQNSKVDTLSVIYLNVRMISDIINASGFRPSNRQLMRMYGSILTTALITYAISESLTISGSVSPFDMGDAPGDMPDGDMDADAVDMPDAADAAEGFSLYSVLRRIRIPGFVVSAAIDGTLNALMTLRIGYITRTYLQQGADAVSGISNKRRVRRHAIKEALLNVPAVIAAGSSVIGKRTAQFLVNLFRKETATA